MAEQGLSTAQLLAQSGGRGGFDPNAIDKNRGAPLKVRAAVGAAHSAKDKLTTLRQWFPDAVSYGDDNFVFTDPETGQPTLYNEEGTSVFGLFNAPSMGDVAGAGIDIATGLGGTVGAVGGGVAGGGVGSVPLAAAGGAAGATLAEQGYDWFAENYLGTVDTRSTGEKAADAALTASLGIVSEFGGAALGQGIKAGVKAAKPTLQNLDAFVRQGVKATPGMVSDSATVRGLEAAGEKLPFAQGPLVKAQERAVAQTEAATQRAAQQAADLAASGRAAEAATAAAPSGGLTATAADRITPVPPAVKQAEEAAQAIRGTIQSPEEAGVALKKAAEGAGTRYKAERGAMDEKIKALVGENRKVGIANVGAQWKRLTDELAAAPDVAASKVGDARAELTKVIREAARGIGKNLDELPHDPKDWPPELLSEVLSKGQLSYNVLRNARSQTGKLLKAPDAGGLRATGKDELEGAYQAVRRDILKAADDVSPEAGKLQRDHDAFVNAFRDGGSDSIAATLTKLTDAASPEEAWKAIRSMAYSDATKFQKAVSKLKPHERDELASAIINDMGMAKPGELGSFSPETLLTNWRKLKEGTKRQLFSDERHRELAKNLADLETITTGMRKAGKLKNRSNTGNVTSWLSLLGGGGGLGYMTDPMIGGGLVATGVGANLASRAWTSPAFVKALAKFSSTPWWDMPTEVARNRLARHLASQSWVGDPAEAYVHQLMESMREPPKRQ